MVERAGARSSDRNRYREWSRSPRHSTRKHRMFSECHWTNPFRIHVPASWVSGIYVARLHGKTSGKESYITFRVRDSRRADSVFQQQSRPITLQWMAGCRPLWRPITLWRPLLYLRAEGLLYSRESLVEPALQPWS